MRRKSNDYPPYMYDDGDRGGFIVKNPLNGKKKRFAADKEHDARQAAIALADYIRQDQQIQAFFKGRPTIATIVDRWETDRLQFMPWDIGTRRNMLAKMRRIRRELGERPIEYTDCIFLEEWMSSFCHTADTFNKWRYALVLLWKFAVARKIVDANEAEKIEERSTSKKIEANRKVRLPLDIEGFRAIHEKAEPWLQLAMEISLVTLQARNEVCNMKHADFRDGYLYVIRDKTSGDSDMAFIKIAVTDQIEEFRRRSLNIDGVTHLTSSRPYLVHRAPQRRRREWIEGKPHWTYVNPDYLTKAFEKTRDQVERFASMPNEQRPTFHEIRGLGARVYQDRGMPEKDIQALMTHAHKRTTEIYLDGGAGALRDDDFQAVSAPLRIADVLR